MVKEAALGDYTRLYIYNKTMFVRVSPRVWKHEKFPFTKEDTLWIDIVDNKLVVKKL